MPGAVVISAAMGAAISAAATGAEAISETRAEAISVAATSAAVATSAGAGTLEAETSEAAVILAAAATSDREFNRRRERTMNGLFASFRVWLLALVAVPCVASVAHGQAALGAATGCSAVEVLSDSPVMGVHDRAGRFSPEAVARARAAIRQFRQDYHRDLFVETFAQVPAAAPKHVTAAYFADWSKHRANTIGVDGVYILICFKPVDVEVVVHPDTPEQAFTGENVKGLRRQLERQLKHSPDAALEDAVRYVRDTVKENLTERQSAGLSIPFGTVAAVIGGVVAVWLLLSFVRAVVVRSKKPDDPSAQASLTAGFCAALFGNTAGHWIYDRVFHAHAPAAPRPESEFLHASPPRPKAKVEHSADDAHAEPRPFESSDGYTVP
jgi:hypothetical protein